jgi:hypothetical protein
VVDPETKYREREVDLIVNADDKRVFDVRHRTIAHCGQLEAEASSRSRPRSRRLRRVVPSPAFDPLERPRPRPLLRIASELYLKRLIVGGYERVFESAGLPQRGMTPRHSPEFTAMGYRPGDMPTGWTSPSGSSTALATPRQAVVRPGRRGHRPHPSVPPPPAPRPGR